MTHDDSFAAPADATHADRPAPNSRLRLWRDPAWMIALLLAIAAPIALRAWMNFRTPIPGGVDAGYYAVQARELLQHGKLAWTDVPLIFALDAAIAKCTMIVLGWSLDDAVLWSSRLVDSVGQPLVALSVFAGAFAWSRGRRSAIPAAIAATLATTVTSPILRMVGDFEKQSLAMAFMAAAWIALGRALASADARQLRVRGAWAIGFFVLTALTHAGTFGAAAMGAAITLVAWSIGGGLTRSGVSRARIAQGAVVAVLVAGVVGAVVLGAIWLLAPLKAKALMDAPMKLFGGGAEGPGGPGGPRGGSMLTLWLAAIGVCAVAIGWTIRRARPAADAPDDQRRTALADGALAIGLAATAAFLACPLIAGDYASRLAIMAPVPLALVLAYVLAYRAAQPRGGWWRAVISPAASVALCAAIAWTSGMGGRGGPPGGPPNSMGGPSGGMSGGPQMITVDGLAELRNWRDELAARGTAVVAARHGLEFWAAFALNCAGRQSALKATDFDRYEHCYMLVESRGGAGGGGGGGEGFGGRGGPPRGRPGRGREDDGEGGDFGGRDEFGGPGGPGGFDDFGGPPPGDDFFGGGPPPRRRGMRGGPPGGGGPMSMGPMSVGPIPSSATIVKRGTWFTLYEVPKSAREELLRDGQTQD